MGTWSGVVCAAVRRFALALAFGAVVPFAFAQDPLPEPERISLHFEGGNLEQNTAEVLSALLQRKLLPLVPFVNLSADKPSEIARNQLKWPDGVVTDTLSRVLCQNNPHICAVDNGRAQWRMQKAGRGQAEDPSAYDCSDPALPAFVVCLPEVHVRTYITSKRVRANPALESIESKVVNDLRGCQNFDVQCRFVISRMNPRGQVPSSDGSTTMLLPTKAFQIRLTADPTRTEEIQQVQRAVVARLERQNRLSRASPDIRLSHPPKLRLDAAAPPIPLGATDSVLKQMSYPGWGMRSSVNKRQVVVGVWDGYADSQHCVFKRKAPPIIVKYDAAAVDGSYGTPPVRGACGAYREFLPSADHATFVTSIIAGTGGRGAIVGADPHAAIWQLEYIGKNLSDPDPLTPALNSDGYPDIRVINISQSYKAQSRTMQSSLHRLLLDQDFSGPNFLFVVAAGNDGQHFIDTGPCDVVPACWSRQTPATNTIISVVALDATGKQLLSSSNRGTMFDVAAIGETKGAAYGNAITKSSGTSFAAPYVSALASLLFDRVDRTKTRINPMRAKHRVLFTSTFIDGLETSLRFGRIDYRRALDFDENVLVLAPGSCLPWKCTMRGKPEADATFTIQHAYDEQGAEVSNVEYRMKEVKRLQSTLLSNGEKRFWVVVRRDGVLTRFTKAKIAQTHLAFAEKNRIPMQAVEDYTACSFSKHCDGDI